MRKRVSRLPAPLIAPLLAAVLAAVAGLAAAPASALDVLSLAHKPANSANRFRLQCGRTGEMSVTALVDVEEEVPTIVLGSLQAEGRDRAMQRRVYASGPGLDPEAHKLGGRKDRWILGKAFTWSFTCRPDCSGIDVGESASFNRPTLEFRFVVGAEGESRTPGQMVFAPQRTAGTPLLSLTCEEATAIGK